MHYPSDVGEIIPVTGDFPPRGLTADPPQSKMLPRRTRQGESDPDGPANHRRKSSRARPEEERREPGEAPEASSGRTKTTLVPSGNSRSAAGTEVSRPEGFGTAQGPIRSRSDEAPAGPGPHPVAPPPTGDGGRRVWDGNGVSGTPGPSGAVGCRKERRCRIPSGISGRVGLGFGDRRVARRSGQGVAPRGSTPSPERLTGRAGGWKWDEDLAPRS